MAALALKAQLSHGIKLEEARIAINDALRREMQLARARRAHFELICIGYEQQYGMSSDEFMQQFEAGSLGDEASFFEWYAGKRGLELWDHKLAVLDGVSV